MKQSTYRQKKGGEGEDILENERLPLDLQNVIRNDHEEKQIFES